MLLHISQSYLSMVKVIGYSVTDMPSFYPICLFVCGLFNDASPVTD
jgi:hypothetical protein